MPELLKAPVTSAQQARDTLLGALVGLARATTSEPKTVNTDEVLNAGLRLAAQPDAPEEKLARMLSIVRAEKHAVAPNCASCAMPCGNTNDYDLARLWSAPEPIRPLKLQMLSAAFSLALRHPRGEAQTAIYQVLFTLAEDWDEALLLPVAENAQKLCAEEIPPQKVRFLPAGFLPEHSREPVANRGFSPFFPQACRVLHRILPPAAFILQFLTRFRKFFQKKTLQMSLKKLLYIYRTSMEPFCAIPLPEQKKYEGGF